MTSIIRLKRQRDEDPVETLMITCKKFKHDEELQRTCQLTFAGTAKSENDCMRVIRNALQLEILDNSYTVSAKAKQSLEVSKKGAKRARPADDLEVVSSIGAENLVNLFQPKRAKLQSESSEKSKFRLVDVEKKSKDLPEDCVYDMFFVTDPNVADASPDVINFFVHQDDICDRESEDEEAKEEIQMEMNYFDDDLEEENYWIKDYPDEFNVFFEKDDDQSISDSGEDDRELEPQKGLPRNFFMCSLHLWNFLLNNF